MVAASQRVENSMLQDIRDNSQSTIAKIIVVAVIVSLSIFGVDAIIGGFGGEPAVATVNGNDITEREYQRAVQTRRQQILSEMERPDPTLLDEGAINREVLEIMINRSLIYQDAKDRGLELSDAEIDQLITSMPVFQVDGTFSQERFLSLVRNRGMGVQEFRDALRRDYIASQVQATVAGSTFAVPATSRELLTLQQQQREIATLTLEPSLVADEITVEESEIEGFYGDNAEAFMRPETVDVAWIEIDRSDLKDAVEVSEDDLRELYEKRLAGMEAREERRSAHILLVPESGDEVAQERIDEVQQALERGDDFADVAERLSDDPGSADAGGELGFANRDSFDPAFSDALFAIEEKGEVSGPVKTSYGVHFIKLLETRTLDKPEFEDLRDNLEDEIASERADQRYIELTDRLADISFSAFDLEGPAAELDLEVQHIDGVSRESNEAPFDHQGLIRQIFSSDVLEEGNNSEVVEVADGLSVVARVREHHPEQKLALERVRDDIEATLRENKIAEALAERAEEMLERLQQGAAPEEVAEGIDANWTAGTMVKRDSPDIASPVLEAAFRLPHPEDQPVYGRADVPAGVSLIQLRAVEVPSVSADDPLIAQIQNIVARQYGGQVAQLYLEALRKSAEIERLQ
ncbi:MAG: peptidylprolyl isomerase [Alteromonadaceae bacterium]|nr:peptidylprolyl isomerase [Alteromonadaceae bacterium]|tara:strand:+ start:2398 stop:4308 length:1911 start_codon:yes stop_codon:yes gene_type:complete